MTQVECGSRRIGCPNCSICARRATSDERDAQGLRFAAHDVLQCSWRPDRGESDYRRNSHSCKACTPPTRTILNPMQCRGQNRRRSRARHRHSLSSAWSSMSMGKWLIGFRNYRISASPTFQTEIFFADTYDPYGPLGAKSAGETLIVPVAPALGNALETRPAFGSIACLSALTAFSRSSINRNEQPRVLLPLLAFVREKMRSSQRGRRASTR